MTYDERLAFFKPLIKGIVTRTRSELDFMEREEVEQELMLALWRCHEKYPDRNDDHFKNTFTNAINGAITDILRRRKREGKKAAKTQMLLDDMVEASVVGDKHFSMSIRDVVGGVSSGAGLMILKSIDPKSKKKKAKEKGWREKRNETEYRREIEKFVYGK